MKISIVIPMYNSENYIERSIYSALNQSYKDIEIIVVDDGSTDNSYEVALNLEKQYSQIKLFKFDNNQGMASAFNKGVKEATGEFITFLASDDSLIVGAIEMMYDAQVRYNADLVIGDLIFLANDNESLIKTSKLEINKITNLYENKEILLNTPSNAGKLYKRSLFIDNNVYYKDTRVAVDLYINSTLYMYIERLVYIGEPVYNYIKNPQSVTNQKDNDRNRDIMISLSNIKEQYILNNKYENFKEELDFLFIDNIFGKITKLRLFKDITLAHQIYGELITFLNDNVPNYINNSYYKKYGMKKRLRAIIYSKSKYLVNSKLHQVYNKLTRN